MSDVYAPRVLDLFSGIGGFSLGLERVGMRTVAFCERDEFCRAVLRKHWPQVHCFDDIRSIDANGLDRLGRIDLVCGGFPCQPFSIAGKQTGKDDDRYLWPAMREVIALARPAWVIGENVAGIVALALDDVLVDLEGLGYAARPFVIPACAVGARHRRDRVWIIACNTNREGKSARAVHDAMAELRGDAPDADRDQYESRSPPHGWPTPSQFSVTDSDSDSIRNNQQRETGRRDDLSNCGDTESGDDGATESLADSTCELLDRTGGTRTSRRTESSDSGESLANTSSDGWEQGGASEGEGFRESGGVSHAAGVASDTDSELRRYRHHGALSDGWLRSQSDEGNRPTLPDEDYWDVEPNVGRVATGIPNRVDRLRALGNAVVPQVVAEIGRAIMKSYGRK